MIAAAALVISVAPLSAVVDRSQAKRPTGGATHAPPLPKAGSVVKAKGVTRTVLAVAEPDNSPGQVLYLTRVRIAPKTKLSEHFHLGVQVARVDSGVLTYKIISGTATVTRASGSVKKFTGPITASLHKGDSIVETSSLVHFGSNRTNEPATIVTALLINQGAGLATPVGTPAGGTQIIVPAELTVTSRDIVTVGPEGLSTIGTVVQAGNGVAEGVGQTSAEPVQVKAVFLVNYLSGSGTWNGKMTVTFADGSTISGVLSGATVATKAGGDAFGGTIGVVGGTGRYKAITGGAGVYTGTRSAAIATNTATTLQTRTELHVFGL